MLEPQFESQSRNWLPRLLIAAFCVASLAQDTHAGASRSYKPGSITWSWPLSNYGRSQVIQDFAEYGGLHNCMPQKGNCKHHSGFDIWTNNVRVDVHAVASGDVRKYVPNGYAGCKDQGDGNCTDHGVGNALVIQHPGHVFSQYDHMDHVDVGLVGRITAKGSGCKPKMGTDKYGAKRDEWDCKIGAIHVSGGQTIGVVGATSFGCDGCYVGVHLHLEAKHFDTLEAPKDHDAFGYSVEHPKVLKYLDPVRFLDGASVVSPSLHVKITPDGDGINLRLGPQRDYPAGLQATQGQTAWAHEVAGATSGCSMGWYKLETTEQFTGNYQDYFVPTMGDFGWLPDVWVCRGDGSTTYVEPV